MFAQPADLAACREMIRTGSRSFFLASRFLPDRVRQAAYALYAFCRLSDDAVDLDDGREDTIVRLRSRLDAVYASAPQDHPVDRALADTVAGFAIPRVVFDALLEGLEWDASDRRYYSLEDVHAYGARVAGSVGAMMAVLMNARAPDLVARACDLGVAMQLTNIVRDVGEDSRMGRVYLPRDWLEADGLDIEAWLAAPGPAPQVANASRRLLAEADRLYRRADAGIANLSPGFRPAILSARRLYAAIGDQVIHLKLDNMTRRAVVPLSTKLVLLARTAVDAGRMGVVSPAGAPLKATAFLVEAVSSSTAASEFTRHSQRGFDADMAWLVDLFSGLEARRELRQQRL